MKDAMDGKGMAEGVGNQCPFKPQLPHLLTLSLAITNSLSLDPKHIERMSEW